MLNDIKNRITKDFGGSGRDAVKMTFSKALIPFVFIGFLLLGCKSPSKKDDVISITLTETYSNSELFPIFSKINHDLGVRPVIPNHEADDGTIDTSQSLSAQLKKQQNEAPSQNMEDVKRENPLMTIMRPNLQQDDQGRYYMVESSIVGFSESADTVSVLKLLSSSDTIPKNISFKWVRNKGDEFYMLCPMKKGGTIFNLTNNDIDSINIDKEGVFKESSVFKIVGAVLGSTEYVITIKLKPSSIDLINKKFNSENPLLINITLNKRDFTLSYKPNELRNGLFIGYNINQSFVDSVKNSYSVLVKL